MTDDDAPRSRGVERPSRLATYGPMLLVVSLLAALFTYLGVTSPRPATSEANPPPTTSGGAEVELPDGVMPFSVAKERGIEDEIDWGERCDTETGTLKLPLNPLQNCFQPFDGDNGGATETGVDADTIKVVVYTAQPDDPVLRFVYDQIGQSDTPDDTFATQQGLAEMFMRYYETYGRTVDLERYRATGSIADSVAATTDAETIARDLAPFVVIGGPLQTNAFADTLARNGIMCIECAPPQPDAFYNDRDPLVWGVGKNSEQNQLMVAEYLGKRLAGRPARWAGDPAMVERERVFGYVHIIASDSSAELEELFVARLRDDYDVSFATIQTYGSPLDLVSTGKDIITALKEAGVTTVVFSGDPLAPQTLTRLATEQDFRPEWIVTGTVLVDTTVFSRTYDQEQWAHAFGISNLFARVPSTEAGAGFLYRWYFGEPAPATATAQLLAGSLQVLFGGLQGAGPGLTHEGFRNALFSAVPRRGTVLSGQVSFGDQGVYPGIDHTAVDDQTEIWWDADAEGIDELVQEGRGMWRYVEGGRRYLPGEWPTSEPAVFDEDGSVTIYERAPGREELPDWEPLR